MLSRILLLLLLLLRVIVLLRRLVWGLVWRLLLSGVLVVLTVVRHGWDGEKAMLGCGVVEGY